MINHEILINKLNYVLTHNKTLSKTNYFIIDEVKQEIEKDFILFLKESYKKTRFVPFSGGYDYKICDNLLKLNFQKLNNKEYKKLYNKAKKLYFEFTNKNDFDDEAAFISTSSIDGFYFPNLENIKLIAFIDGKPILFY